MGHILITDCKNHRVHILDQERRFIQYILTSQQGLLPAYHYRLGQGGIRLGWAVWNYHGGQIPTVEDYRVLVNIEV